MAASFVVVLFAMFGLAVEPSFGFIVQADLTIEKVKVTSVDAQKVEFCYVIRNIGTEPVNLDGVVVSAALSADEHHDAGDVKAGSQTLSNVLEPGQAIQCCCAGLATINPPQTPFLVMTVDVENAIKKSDESNNSAWAALTDAFVKEEPEDKPPALVQRPYPKSDIVVKARPAPTIIFEPPAPPTFVFLPQTITAPRVIIMQKPSAPQVIVIGGDDHGLQIPQSILTPKPPCLCLPAPSVLNGAAAGSPTPAEAR